MQPSVSCPQALIVATITSTSPNHQLASLLYLSRNPSMQPPTLDDSDEPRRLWSACSSMRTSLALMCPCLRPNPPQTASTARAPSMQLGFQARRCLCRRHDFDVPGGSSPMAVVHDIKIAKMRSSHSFVLW